MIAKKIQRSVEKSNDIGQPSLAPTDSFASVRNWRRPSKTASFGSPVRKLRNEHPAGRGSPNNPEARIGPPLNRIRHFPKEIVHSNPDLL
jgi:hypothetical protein